MGRIFVALDVETTGLDAARDEIIEVGAVRFEDGCELDSFSTFVRPSQSIPPEITALTGITEADVATAPPFSAIRERFLRFVGDAIVVGHNVPFDLGFLERAGCPRRHPYLDTLEAATVLLPHEPRYGLGSLAEALDLSGGTRHRALGDARTTMSLVAVLVERAMRLPLDALDRIIVASGSHSWSPRFVFEEAARAKRAGLGGVASVRGNARERSTSQTAPQVPPPDEPLVPVDNRTAIDLEELTALLMPGGALERTLSPFEHRPQQVEMMQAVGNAFNQSRHLLVEAGTGTGKSIAYLLPAIYWAVQNGERVVVSTNTINLQDQLYGKDIPDLRGLLPFDVRAAVLKGRSNYLCPRRLDALMSREALTLAELNVLAKVLAWLPTTETGDRAELSMHDPEEWAVWSRLSSDSDTCTADRCWHRRQSGCFYQRARRLAESAHLVIVNHALLLSDVGTENRVLPQHSYLIVDEAHHLEDATTQQLGYNVPRWALESLIAQLGLRGSSFGGFSGQALGYCRGRVPDDGLAALEDAVTELQDACARALRRLPDLYDDLLAFTQVYRDQPGLYDYRIRLTRDLRIQPEWEHVELTWDILSERLGAISDALERVLDVLGGFEGLGVPGHADLVQDGSGLQHQLSLLRERMEAVLLEPGGEMVTWVQVSSRSDELYLCAVPLRVAHLVERHLLWSKEAAVFTSATLRAGGDFEFIKERLGARDAEELAVGSPFDYPSQVLLYLPTELPAPNEPGYQERFARTLIELAAATEGRMLVLFTSYSQLRGTYDGIHHVLQRQRIVVYAQGQGVSRSQLLERFKNTPRAVLLGTRSFWEGVDVPGPALSCLVVAKLPFSVPTDPVFAARSEEMDDPFYQYAVPDAVLRFRQGFGRLIRTRSDRGVVVVMDSRIRTKPYGRIFLESLPECTLVEGALADLPGRAAEWIAHGAAVAAETTAPGAPKMVELEYVPIDEMFEDS